MRKDLVAALALPTLLACGCTATSDGSPFGAAGGFAGAGASAGAGGDAAGGADGSGAGGSGAGGGFNVGGAGGSGELVAEVYGHSATVLYKLDPLTLEVTTIGPFQGCAYVIDLAIDKDHNLTATTFSGIYAIDKTNAACTLIRSGDYPNSLSFVPEGTVDPNAEALVGFINDAYVRIDVDTGEVQTLGTIGGGYISSGDVVSVIGGSTFLTVKQGGCDDCLIEVDPTDGHMVKNWGALGYSSVFGLTYWGGTAYGFTDGGQLFSISFGTDSVTTTPIAIPGAPPGLSFWGAGSSTAAPVDPPE